MKTILLASALILSPALAFAMGCNGTHAAATAASCPSGTTWDSNKSTCVDAENS